MGKALPCEIGVLRLQGGAHHSDSLLFTPIEARKPAPVTHFLAVLE